MSTYYLTLFHYLIPQDSIVLVIQLQRLYNIISLHLFYSE